MKLNPFVTYDSTTKKLVDGSIFKIPRYCSKNFNTTCAAHYEKVLSEGSDCVCHNGFFTKKMKSVGDIITCLDVVGITNEKQLRYKRDKNEFNPRLPKESFNEIVSNSKLAIQKINAKKYFGVKIEKEQSQNERNRILLEKTLHDIRKLNSQLIIQAEKLKNHIGEEEGEKKTLSSNVFSTSQLISTGLKTYDFGANPSLALMRKAIPMNVFGKFDKARKCFAFNMEEKSLSFSLECEERVNQDFMAHDIFDIIPCILIDNAIKYSPEGAEIICKFQTENGKMKVLELVNFGEVYSEEVDTFKELGIRGETRKNYDGDGFGLYLANEICEIHNIRMNIIKGDIDYIDGDDYQEFIVQLTFDDY